MNTTARADPKISSAYNLERALVEEEKLVAEIECWLPPAMLVGNNTGNYHME